MLQFLGSGLDGEVVGILRTTRLGQAGQGPRTSLAAIQEDQQPNQGKHRKTPRNLKELAFCALLTPLSSYPCGATAGIPAAH